MLVQNIGGAALSAARDRGATLNGNPTAVSARSPLKNALVVTGFSYDRTEHGPAYAAVVGEMLRHARGVRRHGSAALDLAWVACGRLDGYWEFALSPWDLAAGALIAAEAGATLTDSYGGPVSHLDLVVTNGLIHEELRRVVAANRPPHVAR